ncbi:MAG: hypothetical protein IKE29_16855 [Paenibacillus sp.]|uniref:hypothetical protein n=1 Tax=Paenibacillus sp. TaxID=58172 RepID=UPI0025E2889A|nr:hypothetical protein [Paenibacillus sp.]MBR2566269.1 hypothetical protein [Paenibacillus sp.]
MEKIRITSQSQPLEYTCLDDRQLVLDSVMHSVIKERAYSKVYIPNIIRNTNYKNVDLTFTNTDSHFSILASTNEDHSDVVKLNREHMNGNVRTRQNIWNSHVLRNGANNQRWFDKLQDYRNGV